MPIEDISRAAFEPRKHYAGVHMQQGRVTVDDDFNEAQRIAAEEQRLAGVAVIGPAGTPDDGFRVSAPRLAAGQVEFDLAPGSFFLGGLRLALEQAETFRAQRDWLQGPAPAVAAPNADRADLVYLEAYQQPVTAVEDSELFEVALGGPDTAARVRTVRRVHVLSGVSALSCSEAWQSLQEHWAADGQGALSAGHELVPTVTLTVGFTPGGPTDDLCNPPVAGGYLGAENQAIRVQLVGAGTLTWGFDNAAPLYRAQLSANRRVVTLLTEPKDQAHWPLAGQIVEILPWGAVLPNGEKTAEAAGHLTRVTASFNPGSGQLSLLDQVPIAGFDNWTARPDATVLDDQGVYVFLRVWNRGSDTASAPAASFVPGTPLALGGTGLTVTINGTPRAGDHWIIAARPETPNRVVPWELEQGRRPEGVRRFFAPLAFIRWSVQAGVVSVADLDDCREKFRPLTRQRGCCTFEVGDGRTSFGDFNRLEDALGNLPSGGGRICLLPGDHEASVTLRGLRNITISGCLGRTRVVPRANNRTAPIFTVADSREILLEDVELVSFDGPVAEVDASADVTLSKLRIVAGRTAVSFRRSSVVALVDSQVRLLDRATAGVAVLVHADDAVVARSEIAVVADRERPPLPRVPDGPAEPPDPFDPCADFEPIYKRPLFTAAFARRYLKLALRLAPLDAPPFRALGGVQVLGGSERVRVVENTIVGGAGDGVLLGSTLDAAIFVPRDQQSRDFIVDIPGRRIAGEVVTRDGPVAGLPVSFTLQADGRTLPAVSEADGSFVINRTLPGTYRVSESSPDYRITDVERSTRDELGFFRITVEPAVLGSDDLAERLAFLYEIVVEDNRIEGMGRSGVGVPRLDPERIRRGLGNAGGRGLAALASFYLGVIGSYIIGLSVRRNHITGCLRMPFDAALREIAARAGLGGVSLGLVETATLAENHIERNGRSYLDPACGIYIFSGEDIAVDDNLLLENGPLVAPLEEPPRPGIRGGIVIRAATGFSLRDLVRNARGLVVGERPAARVQRNTVVQPTGQALALGAVGPISVVGNQLTSSVARREGPALLAGAVLIVNLGGLLQLNDAARQTTFTNAAGAPITPAFRANFVRADAAELRWPSGATLYNDNQVRLGTAAQAFFAQLILTADDLGYDGNQCDSQSLGVLFSNTLLAGFSLRATSSRFEEFPGRAALSLLSVGLRMNTTATCQGNHCIIAITPASAGRPAFDLANQTLFTSAELCDAISRLLAQRLNPSAARIGRSVLQ